MRKLLTIAGLAIFTAILSLAGCGDNWLENAPTVYIKSINIQGNGTGTITGVATGQVHAVFIGTNTSAESKLVKAQGTTSWTFSVTNLPQGANTVYVIAASGSAYGAPRSWSFVLESEGYEKTFEDVPEPSSSAAASSSVSVDQSSSSAQTETTENYTFDGNIAAARAAITATTAQTINVTVTGIVHATKSPGLFWIQDSTAGIYCYTSKTDAPNIGDKITLTATKGQIYNGLKEVTDYTGYSVVSTTNLVYRQTGTPTAEKQGQAWKTESVVVSSTWNDKSNITVGGVIYRNDSGLSITAGTYRITGPVSQFKTDIQVMVFPGGAVNLNPPASSSAASTSSTGSVGSVNPAGSWAQDAAKPVDQRPFNNYYGAAYGKTGADLKAALKTIISGHTDLGYDGLFTIYAVSDITPDGKIWDIYSDRDGTGMDRAYDFTISTKRCGNYKNEGDCWNREHMIPQSKFGKARPMVSDAHHVLPTDGKVNGIRSSWPHATVGSASFTSLNGSKLGSSSTSGYSGTAFEPINAYKGDTARIYFYFCVRYHNGSISAWESMNSGAKLKSWAQTLYKQWHAADPVSLKEQVRNNGVQQYQKNRNPFIDYPELADLIDFTN